jgi:hypothetical protein
VGGWGVPWVCSALGARARRVCGMDPGPHAPSAPQTHPLPAPPPPHPRLSNARASQAGGYGKVVSQVLIGLRTVKGTKALKLDPTIYDSLQKEKVAVSQQQSGLPQRARPGPARPGFSRPVQGSRPRRARAARPCRPLAALRAPRRRRPLTLHPRAIPAPPPPPPPSSPQRWATSSTSRPTAALSSASAAATRTRQSSTSRRRSMCPCPRWAGWGG